MKILILASKNLIIMTKLALLFNIIQKYSFLFRIFNKIQQKCRAIHKYILFILQICDPNAIIMLIVNHYFINKIGKGIFIRMKDQQRKSIKNHE